MYLNRILMYFLVCGFLSNSAYSQRTKDKMYSSIKGASCFRRLNGTHSTGCSSTFSGSIGVLHHVRSNSDIEFLINHPPSPPYAPIIPPSLFTRENILKLKQAAEDHKLISAIILIHNTTNLNVFSHESQCPNQYSGANGPDESNNCAVKWNPFGTGLLLEDFPFPIYYIGDDGEIEKLIDCFEKFNNFDIENQKYRSLCSIQVKAFMSAAVSSEVCIRRTQLLNNLNPVRYCDPLQGKNVYATLFPRENVAADQRQVQPNERFILLSTRLDTTSLFDGIGPGAMDSLISLTTLVSIGNFLAKVLSERSDSNDRNVLFLAFNGESYDYIGSQRFVYDLQRQAFPSSGAQTNPITLENIDLMIDLGTLDDLNNIEIYHTTNYPEVEQLMDKIRSYSRRFGLNITAKNILQRNNLPPVSAQSFLRENITFKSLIVQSEPKNTFYHSIYDDAVNIDFNYRNISATRDYTKLENLNNVNNDYPNDSIQMRIRNISTILGISIYEFVANKSYIQGSAASSILIDEFLYCFLITADCPLFHASVKHNITIPNAPPPQRYISVHSSYTHEATGWTYRLFGLLFSQKFDEISRENCSHLPYYWFAGYNGLGECRLTTQNFTSAFSPAFLLDDYDWSSGKYSTWTESTWRELSARIFLRPSTAHESLTLSIGVVVMTISFVLIFLINSRSDVLFNQEPSAMPIATPTQC
uniref:Nicastrin n=1 Tax=Corethrella appendiculata TaxID=1370023 RepID=U5EXI1_9DIPT